MEHTFERVYNFRVYEFHQSATISLSFTAHGSTSERKRFRTRSSFLGTERQLGARRRLNGTYTISRGSPAGNYIVVKNTSLRRCTIIFARNRIGPTTDFQPSSANRIRKTNNARTSRHSCHTACCAQIIAFFLYIEIRIARASFGGSDFRKA